MDTGTKWLLVKYSGMLTKVAGFSTSGADVGSVAAVVSSGVIGNVMTDSAKMGAVSVATVADSVAEVDGSVPGAVANGTSGSGPAVRLCEEQAANRKHRQPA